MGLTTRIGRIAVGYRLFGVQRNHMELQLFRGSFLDPFRLSRLALSLWLGPGE